MDKERFISEYLELEARVKEVYRLGNLSEAKNSDNSYLRQWAGDLDMFRQVRNVLVHNIGRDGEPYIHVNDIMEERMEYVWHQLLDVVADVCWKGGQIYSRRLDDNVLETVREMRLRDYTHVPVTDGGMRLIGVFSENTLLAILADGGCDGIGTETTFREIQEFLSGPGDKDALYAIVKDDVYVSECVDEFVYKIQNKKRLDAILVTEDGTADTPIIGLTTIWDLVGR